MGSPRTKLKYHKTWTKVPMQVSRTTTTIWQHIEGLAGARRVVVEEKEGCIGGLACNVVVWASPTAGEYICFVTSLYPVWEEPLSTVISTPLPCQKLTFVIKELSTTNSNLFQITPTISSNGTLLFLTAPTEYRHGLLDDGLNQGWLAYFTDMEVTAVGPNGDVFNYQTMVVGDNLSLAHTFTITVLPVYTKPSFQPVAVIVLQSDGDYPHQTETFAQNVSTGSENEVQTLEFSFKWVFQRVIGWDAVNAAAGIPRATDEAENAGKTNVYKKCLEANLYGLVSASFVRSNDIKACSQQCQLTQDCKYMVFDNAVYPCSLAPACTVVESMFYLEFTSIREL